jgi:hypothetical protein
MAMVGALNSPGQTVVRRPTRTGGRQGRGAIFRVLDSKRGGAEGGRGCSVPFKVGCDGKSRGAVWLGRAMQRSREGGPGRRATSGQQDLGAAATGEWRFRCTTQVCARLDRGKGRGTDMRARGYSAPV